MSADRENAMAEQSGGVSGDGQPIITRGGEDLLWTTYRWSLHSRSRSVANFQQTAGGLMEKWIPSRLLWKRGSARGKLPENVTGTERAGWAVFHRPLAFPTAAKQ